MFAITTAGIASETPLYWELHEYALGVKRKVLRDPTFYPVIYALGEDEDWTDEKNWLRVNPALGDPETEAGKFKDIRAVREDFRQARLSPGLENEFRRFELNQWVAQETRWIPLEEWRRAELFNPEALVGQACYGGLDLSTTQDITAFVLLFPRGDCFDLLPFFWLPEEGLKERSASVAYDRWAKQGLIQLTPGNAIDYRATQKRINELGEIYDIQEIAYDPWNATQVSLELDADGFTMVPMRQSYATMNPASKAFEKAVLAHQVRHNSNPVLTWMVDCLAVKQDPAGNIKPAKPDWRISTKRIDGIVATALST